MFLPKFRGWRGGGGLCLAAAISCTESQKPNTDKRKHARLRNLGNLGRAAQVCGPFKTPGSRGSGAGSGSRWRTHQLHHWDSTRYC